MSDEIPKPAADHPAIRWFFVKWPNWLKVLAAIGTIGGTVGTTLGLGGTIVKAVSSHDENIKAKVVAEQELIQRNKKIDDTLQYHSQQIWTIDQKIDVIGHKLDRIEVSTAKK